MVGGIDDVLENARKGTSVMPPTFEVEVVAADRTVFKGPAVSLVLPGTDGYLGVLHGHAPLITALAIGEITITLPDNSHKSHRRLRRLRRSAAAKNRHPRRLRRTRGRDRHRTRPPGATTRRRTPAHPRRKRRRRPRQNRPPPRHQPARGGVSRALSREDIIEGWLYIISRRDAQYFLNKRNAHAEAGS